MTMSRAAIGGAAIIAFGEDSMSIRALALFVHIVGALALFAGLALEQASLRNLRRATGSAQAREWARLWSALPRVDGPAALTVLASGVYLAAASHVHAAWVALGLLGMVAMGALGGAVTRRRVREIARSLPVGDADPLPTTLSQRLRDPALHAAAAFRLAIALGVVFEMTVKPETISALAGMAVALGAGAFMARDRSAAGARRTVLAAGGEARP